MPDKPITFQNVLELGESNDIWKQSPIPKEINYIWFGPHFEIFNRARVKKCCAKNKDYTVTIWIDELSMLRDIVP